MSLLKTLRRFGVFAALLLTLCAAALAADDAATGTMSFTTETGVSLIVVDSDGTVYEPTLASGTRYRYTLPVGDGYRYIATKNGVYHATVDFAVTAGNGSYPGTVEVTAGDWLTDLSFRTNTRTTVGSALPLDREFSSAVHSYTVTVPDADSRVCIWQKNETNVCTVLYETMTSTGEPEAVEVTPNNNNLAEVTSGKTLEHLLLSGSAYGNTATVRVSKTSGSVTQYTDYTVNFVRSLSLQNLGVSYNGGTVAFEGVEKFDGAATDYTVTLPGAAQELTLNVQPHTDAGKYGDEDNGYFVLVNGEAVTAATVPVALSGTAETESVTVGVRNRYDETLATDYTITVQKAGAVTVRLSLEPADAVLYLYNASTGRRVLPQDGAYALDEGFTYRYMLTDPDYIGRSGAMLAKRVNGTATLTLGAWDAKDQTLTNGKDYSVTAPVALFLLRAAENTTLQPGLSAAWADFRGTAYENGKPAGSTAYSNNAAVSFRTPTDAGDGTLLWAKKLGAGYDASGNTEPGKTLSSPILADGALIVYAGTSIYRIDPDTGETLLEKPMAGTSSFSINGPTYYGGMVFVALSDGRVQAFDAVTLDSLWLYKNERGGQPNCPITVRDGHLYTGFWNAEDGAADFVCLTVTDELPGQTMENKTAVWQQTHIGGFYWAGAYAGEEFVVVGSDDGAGAGKVGTSTLYLFDARTGEILDEAACRGDIRSAVCYDGEAYSFTSKGGYFYRVRVVQDGGSWKFDGLQALVLGGASTSTPVAANGRAYVGVQGTSQFGQSTGHRIAVIDLASFEIAYTVPTQGYPQTSGLLTTAYTSDGGYNYVYFIENYTPGKLRVLRDSPTATDDTRRTAETYNNSTVQAAYALFTPVGEHAQFAICSPIADANGTLYFKNDSGYLMAFGSAAASLELTAPPKKTAYATGDTLDLTGMQVTATLKNGQARDVTKLISAPDRALTAADTALKLTPAADWETYHNEPSGRTMRAGVSTLWPSVTLTLSVTELEENGMFLSDADVVNGTFTLRVKPAEQAKVVCAVFDERGRLLQLKLETVEAGERAADVKVKFSAALPETYTVRCFMLNDKTAPLCKALQRTFGG